MSNTQEKWDPTSLVDDRPISGRQIVIILLCGLVMFLDGFDTQAISYMAPHIAEEWGLGKAVLGPIFSAALFGLMVGYLVLSPLSDKFGHRRMIIVSTAAFAIFTLAGLLATNVTELVAIRFLTGVGLGAAAPSAVAMTGEYSPKRFRASFVLAIYCGYSLGFVVAGLASGWLIEDHGWRSMFVVGALGPALLLPALIFYLPEAISIVARPGADRQRALDTLRRVAPDLPEEQLWKVMDRPRADEKRAPLRELFSRRLVVGTVLLWLIFIINLGEFYSIQSWMPTIMTDLGHPTSIVVAATSLGTVGGIVSAFLVGPLMDRVGPYRTLTGLYLIGAVFVAFVGYSFHLSPPVILVASFLSGLSVSGGQKAAIALSAVFYKADIRSTGVGWALGIGRLGAIGSPLVVGAALGLGLPPRAIFYGLAIPMLILALAVFMMGRRYASTAEETTTPGAVSHA